MALVIKIDGTVEEFIGEDNASQINNLDWLTAQVGGYLEAFSFRSPVKFMGKTYNAMFLDEEGKLKRLPINEVATVIAQKGGLVDDVIVGNIILFADGEID